MTAQRVAHDGASWWVGSGGARAYPGMVVMEKPTGSGSTQRHQFFSTTTASDVPVVQSGLMVISGGEMVRQVAVIPLDIERVMQMRAVRSLLLQELASLPDVEAIFVGEDLHQYQVTTVLHGPSPTEDVVYNLYTKCLYEFQQLSFDFLVLYRRNLLTLTPPMGMTTLHSK